jgi:hypothetical protein
MKNTGPLVSALLLISFALPHSAHAVREADLKTSLICYTLAEGLAVHQQNYGSERKAESLNSALKALKSLDVSAASETMKRDVQQVILTLEKTPHKAVATEVFRGEQEIRIFRALLQDRNKLVQEEERNGLFYPDFTFPVPRLEAVRSLGLKATYVGLFLSALLLSERILGAEVLDQLGYAYELFLVNLFAAEGYLLWPTISSYTKQFPKALVYELFEAPAPSRPGSWSAMTGTRIIQTEAVQQKERDYEELNSLVYLHRHNSKKYRFIVVNSTTENGEPQLIVSIMREPKGRLLSSFSPSFVTHSQ